MKIFLLSHGDFSAVVAAGTPAEARDAVQDAYPDMLGGVDRRTIRCGELRKVELTEQLHKPTILKAY